MRLAKLDAMIVLGFGAFMAVNRAQAGRPC
jgi:hypothetical protein